MTGKHRSISSFRNALVYLDDRIKTFPIMHTYVPVTTFPHFEKGISFLMRAQKTGDTKCNNTGLLTGGIHAEALPALLLYLMYII